VSCGNPEKARRLLGWKATLHMPQVVERLVAAERERRERFTR
jgi:GDP-D-mannose dehydratase